MSLAFCLFFVWGFLSLSFLSVRLLSFYLSISPHRHVVGGESGVVRVWLFLV